MFTHKISYFKLSVLVGNRNNKYYIILLRECSLISNDFLSALIYRATLQQKTKYTYNCKNT